MKLYTPFSTRLSGSAKETELRLRSIFKWKKKRPPMLLLALVLLIALGSGGLVACQNEPILDKDKGGMFVFEDVERMSVVNRELNEATEIGDQQLEGSFTDSIETRSFRRGEKAGAEDSYYDVTWYSSNGTEMAHMGIDPDGTLYVDGYTWRSDEYLNTYELNSRFGAFLRGHIPACEGTSVALDEVEWITQEDTDRAAQLGLDSDQFPNGYYIHDENPGMTIEYPLADNCIFDQVDWESAGSKKIDRNEFMEQIKSQQGNSELFLYQLWVVNGTVRGISECYQP